MSDHTQALLDAIGGFSEATAKDRTRQRTNEYLARIRAELERDRATPESPGKAAAVTAAHGTIEKQSVHDSFDQAADKALASLKGE